jgi:hypothetical protein
MTNEQACPAVAGQVEYRVRCAALYVETDGAYFGVPEVEPWDEPKDARHYTGPLPVVAHPTSRTSTAWARTADALQRP